MTKMEREHYDTGWNDLEYGINSDNWPQEKWQTPQEWATHVREIAKCCLGLSKDRHNRAHAQGIIDCAAHFLLVGSVGRR